MQPGDAFTDAWLALIRSLGRDPSHAASARSETFDLTRSFAARMREVRAIAMQRRVVSDCLGVAVERSFFEQVGGGRIVRW